MVTIYKLLDKLQKSQKYTLELHIRTNIYVLTKTHKKLCELIE